MPEGAQTAQFSFHYTGTNSAFWTVDQVEIVQDDAPEPAIPGAPGAVSARAGDASISVSWDAQADGAPVVGYTATATPETAEAARAVPASCDTTSLACEIDGLTNGVAYRVTVVAHGADGDSPAAVAAALVTPRAAATGGAGTGADADAAGAGSGAGAGGAGTGAGVSSGGALAATGADSSALLIAGAAVLAIGGLLALVGARRRASASE